MREVAVSQIPPYDAQWGVPVSSATLRSGDFKRGPLRAARGAVEALTGGVDFVEAPFQRAVEAIGALEGSEHFSNAVRWLLAMRHFDVASQPLEVQQRLPLWFWESVLEGVERASRFEALKYVGEASFEMAIERWANKPEGVSLSAINYWRRKRSDVWGKLPEHTFFALYG